MKRTPLRRKARLGRRHPESSRRQRPRSVPAPDRCPACKLGELARRQPVVLTIEVAPGYAYPAEAFGRTCDHCGQVRVSPSQQRLAEVKAYAAHREMILVRDGYRCQACGASGVPLHVHHLVHRSQCPGIAGNVPGNLITLCPTCHDAEHGSHQHG